MVKTNIIPPMRIIIASNNQHKIEEIKQAFPPHFELISLAEAGILEEIPEPFNSIEENSFAKAFYIWQTYALPCFADDSGMEVKALDMRPGVNSAYYAGPQKSAEDNMALILDEMKAYSLASDREAQFKTVITLFWEGIPHQFLGILEGTLAAEPQGNNGFGYDPIFIPKAGSRTLAQYTLVEKNKISHRAMALQQVAAFLQAQL